MPQSINQLEQACNEMDVTKIKGSAHAIKGASLSLQCNLLAGIASRIENDAKNNSLENIGILLTELKREWEIVKDIMLQKSSGI